MISDLKAMLTDDRFDRETRMWRIGGWRGDEIAQAAAARHRLRIAPGVCAVGAFAGVIWQSPVILAVFAATAAVGVVAPHHPFEMPVNALAVRRGMQPQPASRAGRRLGCAMGVAFLGGAAVAYAVGAPMLGAWLAGIFGVVAGFVAATNICVPSMILTLIAGSKACTRYQLLPIQARRQES